MIGGKKVLGLIPARGGSKGLPRKNVLPAAGKPLIAWTVKAALASKYLDRVILSSDDDEIMAAAEQAGCEVPFKRPEEFATDQATTLDVARHAVEQLPGFDILVVLQPTSPLRSAGDIDATLEQLITSEANSAVSVTEPAKSPYWSYQMNSKGRLVTLLDEDLAKKRRQDLPTAYVLNGAVYAARIDWLLEQGGFVGADTVAHVMPAERSLDVDTALDLKMVELCLKETA